MHAMAQKIPVTIAIPVKNEEINLPGCLERLSRFEAVVVIDSSSTDRTRQIADDAGAAYLNFQWDGRYPKKRNWYLLNHAPTTPWVLFLDADEFLTDDFIAELETAIAADDIDGFWLGYTNFFQHRPLLHGRGACPIGRCRQRGRRLVVEAGRQQFVRAAVGACAVGDGRARHPPRRTHLERRKAID